MLENEIQSALTAVRKAAEVCQAVQTLITPETLEKADKSPVTIADYASQAVVCRQLKADFGEDPVIGEEGAAELRENPQFLKRVIETLASAAINATRDEVCDWVDHGGLAEYRPRFWTLDPIDGTKGFLRKDQYAISLALIVEGEIKLGVLGCPNLRAFDGSGTTGLLAWAVAGEGAWLQPMDSPDTAPTQLTVSETPETTAARFCESVESGHSAHDWSAKIADKLSIKEEPYRIDSQCKYLAVASGKADIYLRLPTRKGYEEKIWDHAGGVMIVEEAGGMVSDIHGQALDFSQGATLAKNQGVIVTNGRFHDTVVNAVGQYAPE